MDKFLTRLNSFENCMVTNAITPLLVLSVGTLDHDVFGIIEISDTRSDFLVYFETIKTVNILFYDFIQCSS